MSASYTQGCTPGPASAIAAFRAHAPEGVELSVGEKSPSVGVLATANEPLAGSLQHAWRSVHSAEAAPVDFTHLRFVRCDLTHDTWAAITWYGDAKQSATEFDDSQPLPLAGSSIRYRRGLRPDHSTYFALTTLLPAQVVDLVVRLAHKLQFDQAVIGRISEVAVSLCSISWPQLVAVEAASRRIKLQSTIKSKRCLYDLGTAIEATAREQLLSRFSLLGAAPGYLGCSLEPDGAVSWKLYSRITSAEGLENAIRPAT